ncbi:MAG: aminodeoxychorismate synthase component I [Cyanobacteria bacterium P01_H01_bin.121]
MQHSVILQYPQTNEWWYFCTPTEVIVALDLAAVPRALQSVEAKLQAGYYVAGFISYEAAAAFDTALQTHTADDFPLLWFGIYRQPQRLDTAAILELQPHQRYNLGRWQPKIQKQEFEQAIARIKTYIAQGDTYQVNYTFRLAADFTGYAWSLFRDLLATQPRSYAAFVDTGRYAISSISPELFFQQVGSQVIAKPMKGTTQRGKTWLHDQQQVSWLQHSEKNQAENLMIVDMLRNDLSRIAQPHSVQVPKLFEIERYPTLLQMTSTVMAKTQASPTELLRHLFPCASITGAPKVRTMQIINELEPDPRHIYTGAIGCFAPTNPLKGQPLVPTQFNVAIRTVLIDREKAIAEYGVGSGVVWDSDSEQEYQECLTKTEVLQHPMPSFALLETLRWTPQGGFFLLAEHLRRLHDSAQYFEVVYDAIALQEQLQVLQTNLEQASRIRILLNRAGQFKIEVALLTPASDRIVRLCIAPAPIDPEDIFLYHKTTQRQVYEQAKQYAQSQGVDDAVLWNPQGQITETAIANIMVQYQGEWLTPPVECGLLGGTYRAWLLAAGKVQEQVVTLEMLSQSEQICRLNSVRGSEPAQLTPVNA